MQGLHFEVQGSELLPQSWNEVFSLHNLSIRAKALAQVGQQHALLPCWCAAVCLSTCLSSTTACDHHGSSRLMEAQSSWTQIHSSPVAVSHDATRDWRCSCVAAAALVGQGHAHALGYSGQRNPRVFRSRVHSPPGAFTHGTTRGWHFGSRAWIRQQSWPPAFSHREGIQGPDTEC